MLSFKLEIVSPTGSLFSGNVASCSLPTKQGRVTILANHAEYIFLLAEGNIDFIEESELFNLTASSLEDNQTIKVNSGVAEVSKDKVVVLVST